MESIRSVQWRSAASQIITLGSILSMALIIWKMLIFFTACESPVVVVLSGSMEPGFRRGDALFLNMKASPIQSGEIIVFKIEGKETSIVHRVITAHRRHNASEINLLTKGDSNNVEDSRGIYADGQKWLEQHHVMGRVTGYLPFVGWATIVMTEKPLIKYLLIGGLGLLAITSS